MIAVIPARGGSQRIPLKNIKPFFEKPIIAYSIETAQESNLFERIIVSTDSVDIADVALRYGAEVFMRSADLSVDEVGTQEVVRSVLQRLPKLSPDDLACCIYPCAPMMLVSDLLIASSALQKMPYAYYAVPVGTWLRDPGMFYFGRIGAFLNRIPLHSMSLIFKIGEERECDINTLKDWGLAEALYSEFIKRGNDEQ